MLQQEKENLSRCLTKRIKTFKFFFTFACFFCFTLFLRNSENKDEGKETTEGRRKSINFYLWDNFEKRLETWVCVDMWKNHFSFSLRGHCRQRMVLFLSWSWKLEGLFSTPLVRGRFEDCFHAVQPFQNKTQKFTVTFKCLLMKCQNYHNIHRKKVRRLLKLMKQSENFISILQTTFLRH